MTNKSKNRKPFLSTTGSFILKLGLKLVDFMFSKWILAIIFLPFIYGPFLVIQSSLADPTIDTVSLTNAGFAILAALAAVLFNWSRTIDQNDKKLVRKVVYTGEMCLQAAIFFLLASGFKYTYTHIPADKISMLAIGIKKFILFLSSALFAIAVLNFNLAAFKICDVLRDRMRLGEKLTDEENNNNQTN